MQEEQLWVLYGVSPVSWTIPFYVNRDTDNPDIATMFSALPLRKMEEAAVEKLLAPFAVKAYGAWRIRPLDLDRVGKLVKGCTDPERLFSWHPPAPDTITVRDTPDVSLDRQEFLNGLYLTGMFASRAQLSVLWHQICQHMLDWLINRERPVDFYFFRIHNCPYDVEWKQKTAEHIKSHRAELERMSHARRLDSLRTDERFQQRLRKPGLIRLTKQGDLVRRAIELEMAPLWHITVIKSEVARRQMLGQFGYGKYVTESVARFATRALECYAGWMRLLGFPRTTRFFCGPNGQFRIAACLLSPNCFAKGNRGRPKRRLVPPAQPNLATPADLGNQPAPDGTLPAALPTLRQQNHDLRPNRSDLHQPAPQ